MFAADAFDAMTSDRPYNTPRSAEEAIRELRECAGTQFDPVVVDAFRAVWDEAAAEAQDTSRSLPVSTS